MKSRVEIHVSISILKSEVAIASLFHQIQQPHIFLLEVKTITKSLGNGIAEYQILQFTSKRQNSLVLKLKKIDFKGELVSKIQFRPT